MKFIASILLIICYAQCLFAESALLSKVNYKYQDFERMCIIRSALEPLHRPLCPRISKYSFKRAVNLESIKSFIEEKILVAINEADFDQSKDLFISDLYRRQIEIGIGSDYVKDYDPYFAEIFHSLDTPIVWANSSADYLIIVSKNDLTLYLIEGAGVQ